MSRLRLFQFVDTKCRFCQTKRTLYPIGLKRDDSCFHYEAPSYDAASNVIQRRLRDGQLICYRYHNLGRLISKNLPGAEPDASYAYDLKIGSS